MGGFFSRPFDVHHPAYFRHVTITRHCRQLQEVPEALLNYEETGAQENWWEVAGLKKLDLSHNAISLLPDALFTPLTELQVLYVGSNQLSSIPRAMTGCAMTLTRLALPHNELGELPDWIGELNALTYIAVDHNRVSRIPPSIGSLSDMDTLIISHNELTYLPDELCNLKSIKTLNASSNRISALPQNIGNLRGIEQLELGHNKLTSLPPSLRGLCSLVRIDLRENQIREIPALPSSVRLAELLLGAPPSSPSNRLASLSASLVLHLCLSIMCFTVFSIHASSSRDSLPSICSRLFFPTSYSSIYP